MNFFNRFLNNNNVARKTSKKKSIHSRRLDIEPLESRELLTVTTFDPVDYSDLETIQAEYSRFKLDNLSHVYEITFAPEKETPADINTQLQETIDLINKEDAKDILIVVRTDFIDTLTYDKEVTEGSNSAINIAVEEGKGTVSIIGWSSDETPKPLTLKVDSAEWDWSSELRVMNITHESTVQIGGVTITGGRLGNGCDEEPVVEETSDELALPLTVDQITNELNENRTDTQLPVFSGIGDTKDSAS
ncbi:MAG: hypothetical protein ACRC2T_06985, partial [Thermoguttaceae bacterium]